MSSMLNVGLYAHSMNGILTLSDGMGSVIENGQIDALNLAISGETALAGSLSVGNNVVIGNNIIHSGSIHTAQTALSKKILVDGTTKIELGQIDSLHLAISGQTALAGSLAIGDNLVIGNNITNNGSISTAETVYCKNLIVDGLQIKSDTQYQIDFILNYLNIQVI